MKTEEKNKGYQGRWQKHFLAESVVSYVLKKKPLEGKISGSTRHVGPLVTGKPRGIPKEEDCFSSPYWYWTKENAHCDRKMGKKKNNEP